MVSLESLIALPWVAVKFGALLSRRVEEGM